MEISLVTLLTMKIFLKLAEEHIYDGKDLYSHKRRVYKVLEGIKMLVALEFSLYFFAIDCVHLVSSSFVRMYTCDDQCLLWCYVCQLRFRQVSMQLKF